MSIQVIIRSVYGKEMIYPICEKSVLFCRLLGQTTLTRGDVSIIKAIGYVVTVVGETEEL